MGGVNKHLLFWKSYRFFFEISLGNGGGHTTIGQCSFFFFAFLLFSVDNRGWTNSPQCKKWIQQFHDLTEGHVQPGTYWVLQEDNWSSQITEYIKRFMMNTQIFMTTKPGNMTDLLNVMEDGLGKFMKNQISLSYERHFENSKENTQDDFFFK